MMPRAPERCALVVTPFVWEGGPGRGKPTVYRTLQGFRQAGYRVDVVTATNRAGLAFEEVDGLSVHYFHLPLDRGDFAYDAQTSYLTEVRREPSPWLRHLRFRMWWLQFVALGARHARRVARAHRPAFTYGVNNPGIPPSWWVGRQLGVPSFARIMGSEIARLAGVDRDGPAPAADDGSDTSARGTSTAGEVHRGTGPRAIPSAARAAALWLARFDELLAFKLPSAAVIVTDDGQLGPRTITEWLGVPPDRLWLWRNGVDRERFADAPNRSEARAALGIPAERPVVLWVSQLIDWKQPHHLVAAAPAVLAARPDALFLIAGDGPERAALEAQVERLGVSPAFRFEGFVPQSRVPLYYRAADVFATLSRGANIGNTLLEAMVGGLAVVALDTGRTGEVVRHGDTGLLVPADRPGDVGQALARLLVDAPLRERLGRSAARWADENLVTWDERIAREVAAIEAVVAGSRAAGRRA